MGINGGIVRSVFSRTRSSASFGTYHHHGNGRSNAGEKKRWSVVRSYLCGDEFNSVQGEEDSASVKSSEPRVSQFALADDSVETNAMMIEEGDAVKKKEHNTQSSLFLQQDAAIIIQTAFRKLMARRRDEEEAKAKDGGDKQEQHQEMGSGSPGRYSVSTSVEVQTGNSADHLSISENNGEQRYAQKKASRCQDFRSKEDWDDSTLSSNMLRMRIKNRLDATNRRERALAYAFSQQLRICSRSKQARSECTQQQPSMSWHWLERWMATRAPEFSFESHSNKQFEQPSKNNSHREGKGKCLDLAVEERESCGSNDVPVPAKSLKADAGLENGSFIITTKNGAKPLRSISRRKTVPSYQYPPKEQKTVEKSCANLEHDKRQKLKRSKSNRETKCKDASASYNYGNMHFLVN
ncbi:unnamed protein product [Linum trigynum]|uniref:Uncharacterized protein n=1 Tax=Linum trigynum TaxID=586398 RepID=A0AAV2CJW6_9ROSI